MNVRVERDELKGALARVKPAVDRRANPALSGVLLEAGDEGVTVTATNLDVRIHTTCAAAFVEAPGRVLVQHETLERVVTNCPAGAVHLDLDGDNGAVHVGAGKVKAQLRTMDEATFPRPPVMDAPKVTTLEDDWRAIQRVMHVRGLDPARPILTGVHMADGRVEATDSYRLAHHAVDCDIDFLFDPTCLAAAIKVCPAGPVTLRRQGTRYELEASGTVWSGQGIDGQFPKTAGLVPADTPMSFTCDADELAGAVKVAAAIGEETHTDSKGKDYRTSTVRVTLTGDGVVVRCKNPDSGDAEVAVDAGCTGEATVAFNAPYLLSLLGALTEPTVTLRGVDPLKPWVATEGGQLQLLMPVRV